MEDRTKMRNVIAVILATVLLPGCAMLSAGRHTLGSMAEISVDMDKRKVEQVLGKPNVVRIGKKISDDMVYELHEYKLFDDASVSTLSWFLIIPASFLGTETFWLHYINSKLIFWGDEGDWRGAPKWFSAYYTAIPPSQGQAASELKTPSVSAPE
jgi:hypothetical protein